MNRLITRVCILFTLLFVTAVFISAESQESQFYVKIVYVDKVTLHQLGYKVDYRTSTGVQNTTYFPIKWFYGTGGKAELVESWDKSTPYLEVYYVAGKFDHLRLHVVPDPSDYTWGTLRSNEKLDDYFNI